MEKYKNKYRIPSARLQNWDYGSEGAYFITICTQNRIHFFGEIAEGGMHTNEIGKIVESEWEKTPEIRPDMHLKLGEFVVMPNHFHAIIIIGENQYNTQRRDAMHCVSTTATTTANINSLDKPANKFGPQSKNLASIVRGFKSSVTKNARLIHADFNWQSRFHDHIIRDAKTFETIQNYIANNPVNWEKDKFYV